MNKLLIITASYRNKGLLDLGKEYRQLGATYPVFFKMDNLCKLGWLAAEHVMRQLNLAPQGAQDQVPLKPDTGVLFFNRTSSTDNDLKYQATLDPTNYFPSPALFVYTLANIVTGQVAIRHKIMGETGFYITQDFDPQALIRTVQGAFTADGSLTRVLCGWVEYYEGESDVLVMAVEPAPEGETAQETLPFTEEQLLNLYNNYGRTD